MAEYLDSAITGSFTLPLVMSESIANTGSAGGLYYNLSKNRVYYTYCQAGSSEAGSWSAGPNINTARSYTFGNAGSRNAGLLVAGATPTYVACTEEYNGTSWSVGGAIGSTRAYGVSFGTQNAATYAGGETQPAGTDVACTEEYDGSSWSTGGALSAARYGAGAGGTQDSAFFAGGYSGGTQRCATEEYNGTSWAAGGNINCTRGYLAGGGESVNSGIIFGGRSPETGDTEEYNGTSWTSVGTMITVRRLNSGTGTVNSAITLGGYVAPSNYSCTEQWDGSSWSAAGALIIAARMGQTGGTSNDNIYAGGFQGSQVTSTYTFDSPSTPGGICTTILGAYASGSNTLLGSGSAFPSSVSYALSGTWSAGPNRAQCLYAPVVTGDLDSSLAVGGRAMPASGVNGYLKCTEHYDGYSWSTGGALSNGSYLQNMWGSQNAAVRAGGYCYPSPNAQACTEEYNGSSWSTGPNLPASRYGGVSAGTQNDGIMSAGNDGTNQHTTTYTWNGTSWATGTAKITTMRYGGGVGETSDNLFAAQGYINPAVTNIVEHWNGSSWSSCTSAPVAQSAITAGGIGVNDYVSASGGGTDTISWNGSAWAAQATSPSVGYNYQSVVRSSKGMMQVGFSQSTPYRACATCLYTRDTN